MTPDARITIRREEPGDSASVRRVNDLAFGQPDESRIVDALHASGSVILSLVAESGGCVIGHILFSPVTIEAATGSRLAGGLAPMAVLPEFQRKGIGSRLVREGLQELRRLGQDAVVLVGHPEYYPRFGFIPASRFGLRCEFDCPDEAFMALELRNGALAGSTGIVRYRPEFRGA